MTSGPGAPTIPDSMRTTGSAALRQFVRDGCREVVVADVIEPPSHGGQVGGNGRTQGPRQRKRGVGISNPAGSSEKPVPNALMAAFLQGPQLEEQTHLVVSVPLRQCLLLAAREHVPDGPSGSCRRRRSSTSTPRRLPDAIAISPWSAEWLTFEADPCRPVAHQRTGFPVFQGNEPKVRVVAVESFAEDGPQCRPAKPELPTRAQGAEPVPTRHLVPVEPLQGPLLPATDRDSDRHERPWRSPPRRKDATTARRDEPRLHRDG